LGLMNSMVPGGAGPIGVWAGLPPLRFKAVRNPCADLAEIAQRDRALGKT